MNSQRKQVRDAFALTNMLVPPIMDVSIEGLLICETAAARLANRNGVTLREIYQLIARTIPRRTTQEATIEIVATAVYNLIVTRSNDANATQPNTINEGSK